MAKTLSDGDQAILEEQAADAYLCGGCEPGCEECASRERTVSRDTIRRAAAEAERERPAAFELCPGFWACESASKPGTGYMVSLDRHDSPQCECEGYARVGYCYHAATVAMQRGTLPAWATETEAEQATRRETSVLATRSGLGKASLFA